jgi:hypothetical protein
MSGSILVLVPARWCVCVVQRAVCRLGVRNKCCHNLCSCGLYSSLSIGIGYVRLPKRRGCCALRISCHQGPFPQIGVYVGGPSD